MTDDFWNIPVNWNEPVDYAWEFKTDVFTSHDGNEQRRALREKPRLSIDYTSTFHGQEARDLRSMVAGRLYDPIFVPNFVDNVSAAVDVAVVTDVLVVDSIPIWARYTRPIAVKNKSGWSFRRITSVADGVINLDVPVAIDFTTVIASAVAARLTPQSTITKKTDSVATMKVSVRETPTTSVDPVPPLGEEEGQTYRGFPVLTVEPNWSETVEEAFTRDADVVDFGFGATAIYTKTKQPTAIFKHTVLAKDRVAAKNMIDFFCRRKGRRGSFYAPTWSTDLVFPALSTGVTTVMCEGRTAFDLFNDSFIYRNLAVIKNKVIYPLGISKVELIGGNTRVSLDVPVPLSISGSTSASWFVMARFASDILSVRWYTDQVAEFTVSFMTLIETIYELSIDYDAVTFGGDYLVFPPIARRAPFIPTGLGGELINAGEDFAG